jgi:hypothetical protein
MPPAPPTVTFPTLGAGCLEEVASGIEADPRDAPPVRGGGVWSARDAASCREPFVKRSLGGRSPPGSGRAAPGKNAEAPSGAMMVASSPVYDCCCEALIDVAPESRSAIDWSSSRISRQELGRFAVLLEAPHDEALED